MKVTLEAADFGVVLISIEAELRGLPARFVQVVDSRGKAVFDGRDAGVATKLGLFSRTAAKAMAQVFGRLFGGLILKFGFVLQKPDWYGKPDARTGTICSRGDSLDRRMGAPPA